MSRDMRQLGILSRYFNFTYYCCSPPNLVRTTNKQWHEDIQGYSKRWAPGCVNMRWKNCALLPAVGKQTATFSPYFTQPGVHLLEIPCTSVEIWETSFQASLYSSFCLLVYLLYSMAANDVLNCRRGERLCVAVLLLGVARPSSLSSFISFLSPDGVPHFECLHFSPQHDSRRSNRGEREEEEE